MNVYDSELIESLMADTNLVSYMKKAVDTGDANTILQATKLVIHARDPREVTIREFVREAPRKEAK